MECKALFTGCTGEIAVSKTATLEFYLLYQQSVLLSLKEQGVLNEVEYQLCMDALTL